jgi:hypothetical protein
MRLNMAFAFNPDAGPARLIRYVEPGTLPGINLLAVLDKKANLLIIDKVLFERLTDTERQLVLKTQQPFLEVDFANQRPSLAA